VSESLLRVCRRWLGAMLLVPFAGVPALNAQAHDQPEMQPPLRVEGRQFLLHGKPFQILSGELEYTRIPRADWSDRLRKVHAMGLNTITIYVFWNVHETTPGVYDFKGQNDVAEFVREAQKEGLYVVLRPGPYVCAEWDLGGYPAWLLKSHEMVLRSAQTAYLEAAMRWMLRLGKELAPLQASRGGPILAVQVENEYGSFSVEEDRQRYLEKVRQMVLDAGFGESLLYTADGGEEMSKGSIPGVFAAVDFGTGDAERSLALLHNFRPDAPVYVAEYWDGWFDHWGAEHQRTDAAKQEAEIRTMIEQGDSINLYMIHGGTSFGWMNGANSNDGSYQPDVSSYDYDAPIDEAGRLRPKYFALRRMISEVTHTMPPPIPNSAPLAKLPEMRLIVSRSLWNGLPTGAQSKVPLSMEDLDQAYGYIVYRTRVPAVQGSEALLSFDALHSYARVYVDGELAGVIDRRLGQTTLKLVARAGQRLDLLVENSGRVNFTTQIRKERAGIPGEVRLNGQTLHGWEMVTLPLAEPPSDGFEKQSCRGPCFYRGEFTVNTVGDTYLNTAQLGKGVVWVDGHLLGRFWNVGPMGSLFLPGAWLHKGSNDVTVLDLNGGPSVVVRGEDHPTYLTPMTERTSPLPQQ
jgi:beta-galactosidase